MRKLYHVGRAKINEMSERFARRSQDTSTYDAILVSYGGSGTTFILKYLSSFMNVNSWDSHNDGIKHANSPNHPIFSNLHIKKCVYVYSDPMKAALSLFRREFQSHMSVKLQDGNYSSVQDYNKHTKGHLPTFSLNDMILSGEDYLGINSHWKNWTLVKPDFPILFTRFESFYENLDSFFDFLEIDDRRRSTFPPKKERKSSVQQHSIDVQDALRTIYGETLADMEAREPTFVRT